MNLHMTFACPAGTEFRMPAFDDYDEATKVAIADLRASDDHPDEVEAAISRFQKAPDNGIHISGNADQKLVEAIIEAVRIFANGGLLEGHVNAGIDEETGCGGINFDLGRRP